MSLTIVYNINRRWNNMKLNEIIMNFSNAKRLKSNSYQVKCPCHNDRVASLTITEENDKILMKCHAGCDTRDILNAIGLKMADLYNNDEYKAYINSTKSWWQEAFNIKPEAVYNYGNYIKVRLPDKKIFYGRLINGKYEKGMGEYNKTIYKPKSIIKARANNSYIYVCEGEKDVDTLLSHGFCATTAGGVNDWKKDFAEYFKGCRVVLLPDNDEPGIKLMKEIKEDLMDYAFAVKTVMTSTKEKGDITDWFNEGNTNADFKMLVEKQHWQYPDFIYVSKDKLNINSDLLASHIDRVLPHILVYRPGLDICDYYGYKNGVYSKQSKLDVKATIKEFLPVGISTDYLLNNTYNLLMAGALHKCRIEALNTNDSIINCKNGLYNIDTGELMPHTHKELTTLQLNCNYNKDAPIPQTFINYINDLCSNGETVDESKKMVLQEWLGLLISNINIYETKKSLMLYSPLGNTGKSVFLNIIKEFLGVENTINIPLQKMSDRFVVADMYGKRVNIVGDQQSNDISDSSGFKQATGGDPLKVEFKGKGGFNWVYTGGVVTACNVLPSFTDDKGGHIFERISLIPCEYTIPAEKRDGKLLNKLTKELDGIFIWAMEGLKRLKDNNFKFSKCLASEECVKEYRENVDTFYRFINENYTVTFDRANKVKKTDLENDYIQWYRDNVSFMTINKRKIKEKAEKNGIIVLFVNGIKYYCGLIKNSPNGFASTNEEIPEQFI